MPKRGVNMGPFANLYHTSFLLLGETHAGAILVVVAVILAVVAAILVRVGAILVEVVAILVVVVDILRLRGSANFKMHMHLEMCTPKGPRAAARWPQMARR